MADNYKILAQTTAAIVEEASSVNQANVVYTVPANTQAAISSISLINSSSTVEDYYLGVVKAADTSSSFTPQGFSKFVATASSFDRSGGAYSNDGINWLESTLPPEAYDGPMAYGNGKFVAIRTTLSGLLTVLSSANGITWTQIVIPNVWPSILSLFISLSYGNGKFVAVADGSSTALYSSNGIDWTEAALPGAHGWYEVAYGNGRFVAMSSGTAAYSLDGISWSFSSLPIGGSGVFTYGNGKFVALIWSDAIYSEDGISWSIAALPGSYFWRSIAYGNGKFVGIPATGSNGTLVVYSSDAVSWSTSSFPLGRNWMSIVYGNNKFVAVAAYIPPTTTGLELAAYSEDGITWTIATMPAIAPWNSLVYGESVIQLPTISSSQIIIPNRSIEPNTVDEVTGGITLSAGDQIRVYSESSDLIVQVYGVEIA